jgi:hypothetical protein
MLHLILAVSSLTDDFEMCILGYVLVAASAALMWTNWCLRSCCVPISDIFDEASANWPDLDPLGPG